MLGAPPDPLKLSSATPVVLHASAGPPAKRVRPWAQSGPRGPGAAQTCDPLLHTTSPGPPGSSACHDDLGSDSHAVEQVADVVVVHANAAIEGKLADRVRPVCHDAGAKF